MPTAHLFGTIQIMINPNHSRLTVDKNIFIPPMGNSYQLQPRYNLHLHTRMTVKPRQQTLFLLDFSSNLSQFRIEHFGWPALLFAIIFLVSPRLIIPF